MSNIYWVNGTGNWSDDINHWSTTSGGSPGISTTVDSYSETNYDNDDWSVYASNVSVAQSFTGTDSVLTSAKFYLKKLGSPTGNIIAKLYSMTGTYGSTSKPNALLATSDNVNVTTIGTSYGLQSFNFSTPYTIISGTKYCIAVEYTGGDVSNRILVGSDKSSPSHSGNMSSNLGVWTALSNYDLCFYIYAKISGTLPTSSDDVFIDSNSGISGGTILIDVNPNCNNFLSNSGFNYTLGESDGRMNIYGSLTFESGINYTADGSGDYQGSIKLLATTPGHTIKTAGVSLLGGINIVGAGGWKLLDDFITTGEFYQENGTFDANNHNVTASDFNIYANVGYTPTVIMGSETWEGNEWYLKEEGGQLVTLNADTSTIKLINNYDNYFAGKTYYNLWVTGNVNIYGSNIFNNLRIDAGAQFSCDNSTTQTISSLTAIGTIGNLIIFNSTGGGVQFTLSKSSGTVVCDYLDLSNSNVTGGATWYAGSHSINTDNNSGWIFSDMPTNQGNFLSFM